jgi:hypothetical protein
MWALYIAMSVGIVSAKLSLLDQSTFPLCRSSTSASFSLLPLCTESEGSKYDLEHGWIRGDRTFKGSRQSAIFSSDVNANGYWASYPQCIQQNDTDTFCVYSSASFADGRGIAVFTTPENAKKLLNLPAFANSHVHSGVNIEPNPPYVAKELPGRGIGLIMNRTLHRGDRIFSSTPVLVVEEEIFENFRLDDRGPLQNAAIAGLPAGSEKGFMGLCGHFGGDLVDDIINTNSFAVDVPLGDEEISYNVVFPEMSVSGSQQLHC